MIDIGDALVNGTGLSVDQANQVYLDLTQLKAEGRWTIPDWAIRLSEYYHVSEAHPAVIERAWMAVAESFRRDWMTTHGY